jgi:peptidyl-prolyl cis-trans isomerase C
MAKGLSLSTLCVIAFMLASVFAAGGQQPAAGSVTPPPAAAQGQDNVVVARVSGEAVSEKEVLEAIDQLASRQQLDQQQLKQKDTLLFSQALDNVIATVLLRNEARDMKLTLDKAKVDEAYQQISKRFPSEEEFKKALATRGLDEAGLRKALEENMLVSLAIEQAVREIPAAADTDIKKFYDENPKYFEQPEQAHAAHILLRVPPNSTPEQKTEVQSRLEGIRADIESKKITFAEAATKYSDDKGSAQKGGDLGFFSRGRMVKPFEDAVFSSTAGTLTPIIETQFGYHLIEVIEIKPARKMSLEEASDKIKTYLEGKTKQEMVEKHVADLRAKTTIEMVMTQEQWDKLHAAK